MKSVWLYNLKFSIETSLHDVCHVKLLVIKAYLSTCISRYYSERQYIPLLTILGCQCACVCVYLGEHNAKYSHTRSTEPGANNKTTLNCVQQVTALLHHNYNLSDEEILVWSIVMSLHVLKM